MKPIRTFFAAAGLLLCSATALAQTPPVPRYGANVTLDQARKAMAAAIADSRRQNLPMAIAVAAK